MVSETEKKIFEAARSVFMQKGIDGARMQEIADAAGINKAMLHYYFRTKEKLFVAIVAEAFADFFPNMIDIALLDLPIRDKIGAFIDRYLDMVGKNPFLPHFMIHALYRNPELAGEVVANMGHFPKQIIGLIANEMEKGTIPKSSPQHFVLNLVSMLIFPIVGRPIVQLIYFDNDVELYNGILKERKEEILKTILKEQ